MMSSAMWMTLIVPASYLVACWIGKRMRKSNEPAWRSYLLSLLPGLAIAAAVTLRVSQEEAAKAVLLWAAWAALGTAHAWRGQPKTTLTTLNLFGREPR